MKVAFATTDGLRVDEHFGRAGLFAVYELTEDGYHELETRHFSSADGIDSDIENTKDMKEMHETKAGDKVERLSDCKIVYLTEIGGPMAARLAKKGMMPVKVACGVFIKDAMEKLYDTIKGSPPIWLKKALNNIKDGGSI
ncbi:nitrogen fixation protein NifX [Candidatus Magnetoovum chiemensis]|nr:nitrogen fixation protein NifX [Candidatus Magnetoovum chiemensis]